MTTEQHFLYPKESIEFFLSSAHKHLEQLIIQSNGKRTRKNPALLAYVEKSIEKQLEVIQNYTLDLRLGNYIRTPEEQMRYDEWVKECKEEDSRWTSADMKE